MLPRASCTLITRIFRSDAGDAGRALFCMAHDTSPSTDLPDQVPPVSPVVTGDGHHFGILTYEEADVALCLDESVELRSSKFGRCVVIRNHL